MASACFFPSLLEYPGSPVHVALPDALLRRTLMGLAIGATGIAIVYSPLGKRSGAHINPAVTLTFWRLGRVRGWDAFFYVLAQYAGAVSGLLVCASIAPAVVMNRSVNYVVTIPGDAGGITAVLAELGMSFALILVVLIVKGDAASARYTGLVAGAMVATFIAIEAPCSGMSKNPARSAASEIFAQVWIGWWIYLVVPPLAMLLAAELYVPALASARVGCANLYHTDDVRSIFCGHL